MIWFSIYVGVALIVPCVFVLLDDTIADVDDLLTMTGAWVVILMWPVVLVLAIIYAPFWASGRLGIEIRRRRTLAIREDANG